MNVTNSLLAVSCVVSCMYTFILPISHLVQKKKKTHSLRITVVGLKMLRGLKHSCCVQNADNLQYIISPLSKKAMGNKVTHLDNDPYLSN